MKTPRILATTIAALLVSVSAQAALYTWDIGQGDGAAITPGDGTWNTTLTNWNSAGANVPWVNGNTAVFGGADGTYAITLVSGLSTLGLTFNNSGYTLGAASPTTLTLTGSAISIVSGKSATIGTNVTLARTGAYTLVGGGRLIVAGAVTASTGATEIKDGSTLEIPNGGNVTFNGSPVIGSNTTAAISQDGNLLISGGSVATNGASTNFVIGNMNSGTTNATVTINAGSLTVGSNSLDGIRFGSNTPSGGTINGTFNLDGGTVTAPAVRRYNPGGSSVINATFNFNGGTLKANAVKSTNGSTFFEGGITANVKAGGAKIDTNGFNIPITQALLDAGGGGGLEKLGAGVLTLTGANTYTGTTTVSAGTLAIGAGGTVGSIGTGPIVNNATLTFNRSDSVTLANNISGSGPLNLNGSGTTTLGGASTYTGATNVNSGRLQLTGSLTSDVSLATGVNIGGEGSTTGSLTFNGTHTLFFDPTTPGALTANTVVATGATVTLSLSAVTGAATGIVVLNAPGGIAGTAGLAGNFRFTGRGSAYLNGGNTQLLFDYAPATLVWKGNTANPTFWDVQTTQNWSNAGTPDTFMMGDTVLLDDTASTFTIDVKTPSPQPSVATFNNTMAHTYTLQGAALAGTGTIVKNNTGTLIVANDNTYSGGTTINAGTVQLGDGVNATGALGTGPVTNNAALVTDFGASLVAVANDIGGTGTLQQNGVGTVALTGTSTFSGPTLIAAGTLQLGAGGTTGALGTGGVINNATLAFNRTDSSSTTNAISGTGNLVKLGTGTVALGKTNTYSGLTTITAGAILVNVNGTVLGDTTSGTVVSGTGAALQLQGGVTVTGEALSIVGDGVNGASAPGALRSLGGNNEWTGDITVGNGATTRVVSDTGSLKISGNVALSPTAGDQFVLQGNGDGEISGIISGVARVTRSVTGTGTWTLSGANTYTGKSVASGGFLRVSSFNSVVGGTPSSSLGAPTTVGNGTIDLANTTFAGGLIYTGSGETTDRIVNLAGSTGGGTIEQAGTGLLTFTSNLAALAGSKTLTLLGSTAGVGQFAGVIGNGSGTVSLAKSGTGSWLLSNVNSYTGSTNISAGSLVLGSGASIAGSSSFNIAGGATLDASATGTPFPVTGTQSLTGGTGAVAGNLTGSVTATAGATVAPGFAAGTTGILAVSSDFSLDATSHLSLDLAGNIAGTGYDRLVVNSGVITLAGDLAGSTLTFTPSVADIFYIIVHNGAGATTGTLGGAPEGGSVFIGAQQFQISYTSDFGGAGYTVNGLGNDVALRAIPEPCSAALLLGAGSLLGLRRRRS